jgi:hypothetical protein
MLRADLILRLFMNRYDDRACLCVSHARLRATRGQADRPGLYSQWIFFEEVRSHCLRTTEERFTADKGTSEGATVFMNNPGQRGSNYGN